MKERRVALIPTLKLWKYELVTTARRSSSSSSKPVSVNCEPGSRPEE
jgi:hypothetical protein